MTTESLGPRQARKALKAAYAELAKEPTISSPGDLLLDFEMTSSTHEGINNAINAIRLTIKSPNHVTQIFCSAFMAHKADLDIDEVHAYSELGEKLYDLYRVVNMARVLARLPRLMGKP